MENKELYSIRETGTILSFGATKVREMISRGSLVAVKIDGSTRITAKSISDLLADAPAFKSKGDAA